MKIVEIKSLLVDLAQRSGTGLLSLLYPSHCAVCKADTEGGSHLCAECEKGARRIKAPFCERCSQPFDGAISGKFICSNCEDRTFHFECAVAPFLSRGPVREFIHRFKYNRHLHLRHQLVDWMALGLADERILKSPAHALVPVPLHSARQREREFNQAETLARLLSKRSGIPLAPCLQRTRYTTTQTRFETTVTDARTAVAVRNADDWNINFPNAARSSTGLLNKKNRAPGCRPAYMQVGLAGITQMFISGRGKAGEGDGRDFWLRAGWNGEPPKRPGRAPRGAKRAERPARQHGLMLAWAVLIL